MIFTKDGYGWADVFRRQIVAGKLPILEPVQSLGAVGVGPAIPKCSVTRLRQRDDKIGGKPVALVISGDVSVLPSVQSAAPGANPNTAVPACADGGNGVLGQPTLLGISHKGFRGQSFQTFGG